MEVFDDFHTHDVFIFYLGPVVYSAGHVMTFSQTNEAVVYDIHHMQGSPG
jgi:hypothetical protein